MDSGYTGKQVSILTFSLIFKIGMLRFWYKVNILSCWSWKHIFVTCAVSFFRIHKPPIHPLLLLESSCKMNFWWRNKQIQRTQTVFAQSGWNRKFWVLQKRCIKWIIFCLSNSKSLKWRQWNVLITLILWIRLKWSTASRNVNFLGYLKFTVIFSVPWFWYLFKGVAKFNHWNHGLIHNLKSSCQIF